MYFSRFVSGRRLMAVMLIAESCLIDAVQGGALYLIQEPSSFPSSPSSPSGSPPYSPSNICAA